MRTGSRTANPWCKASHSRDEQGVVMLILAIIIFAFFIVAAFGLDFSQMTVSSQQGTNYAKFAALSALKAYSSAPSSLSKSEKLALALTAANDSGSLNLVLNAGGQEHSDTLQDTEDGVHPALLAGKYYAEAPAGNLACTNPCMEGESPPCFVPIANAKLACEPTGTAEVSANAFRVKGRYFSNVKSIFSQIFTAGTYSINVDEIAAFSPRRGIMMVDISDSMFRETHSMENAHPAYYSYYLTADNGSTPFKGYDTSWTALQADRTHPTDTPPALTDSEYPKVHYQSDYEVVVPLTDADYSTNPDYAKYHPNPNATGTTANYHASQISGNYRIDTYRNSPYYGGPEPFTTVMQGLNTAVQSFRERAVTGDNLGLIFFDKTISWPRVINLTSDFDYLQKFTDLSPSANQNQGLPLLLKHGIFPGNDNKSNLMLAINEAMRQFNNTQTQTIPSVDFMVYYGDGLANCASNLPPQIAADGLCGDDWDRYTYAVKELKDFATQTLYPRRIPLNIVLVGSNVRPHTLALNNGSGNCMSDTEARNSETAFVRGDSYRSASEWRNAYWNMSSANPFYQVNVDMYQLTRITGGIWGPLMQRTSNPALCKPDCNSTDPSSATRVEYSCSGMSTDINNYISQIMGSNPFMIVPHSSQ